MDKERTIITHDAGSPRDQMTPFWESTAPLSYLGWGKTTQLGYGLGLAMGAKLAKPDHLCINVWGDAAIGFTGMDLETAARERIPILSILFNNFSMAIEIPIMPVSQAKYGSTDISGNYADMARAFGCYGERITDPGDIVAALRRGIEATEHGPSGAARIHHRQGNHHFPGIAGRVEGAAPSRLDVTSRSPQPWLPPGDNACSPDSSPSGSSVPWSGRRQATP